jgi:hypothetical protein
MTTRCGCWCRSCNWRGLFQKEYAGTPLRENLGLAIPRATDWHAARRKASARHL